jgi:CBS-domain-containing membrane protein
MVQRPARPPLRMVAATAAGATLAIALVAGLTEATDESFLLASFGASTMLLFGLPDSALAQPRNVVGGQVVGMAAGLAVHELGDAWWSASLGVGLAIAVMMLTGTMHPPAASNPILVYLTAPAWSALLLPTFVGAVLIVAVATIYHRVVRPAVRYPAYWWA